VGTVDSGLNSLVLASNNERVLLPVNEPTFGTKRKSQVHDAPSPPPSFFHSLPPSLPPLLSPSILGTKVASRLDWITLP
jgi:hypothetical protein